MIAPNAAHTFNGFERFGTPPLVFHPSLRRDFRMKIGRPNLDRANAKTARTATEEKDNHP
jgi:hypothetical protein